MYTFLELLPTANKSPTELKSAHRTASGSLKMHVFTKQLFFIIHFNGMRSEDDYPRFKLQGGFLLLLVIYIALKDHIYRMVIVEGCCTMARSSSFRSKLFIG